MTPESYRRITELFHSALECDPAERRAFLARACEGDATLRAQVEALLSAHEGPGHFLDSPAYELVASSLVKEQRAALTGRRLGHYQILALLGEGGMGEVYLALDERLRRKVALKVLPAYLADDENRIGRFAREARAASALNHPNIVTIYEIGEVEGRHFIATEFIQGTTLRQHMKDAPMSLGEVLDVTIQAADALSKAHQAGIVHRDIKPENIMIDGDRRVKVLDFGLAKYTPPPGTDYRETSNTYTAHTMPGSVMGTTAYMSPEQARGLEVDARTDVWSLGVVLYEMIAGTTPFKGPTASDLLAAILEREPEPLAGQTFAVPDELRRIVGRALRKELGGRYPTINDFVFDLDNLRREPGFAAKAAARPALSETRGRPVIASDAADEQTQINAGRIARPRRGRGRRLAALLLCAAAALTAVLILGVWRRPPTDSSSLGPPAESAAANPERRLSYWLVVQKYRDGKPYQDPFRPDGEFKFENDDHIRLHLDSSQAGHLYVLNEGPGGSQRDSPLVVLFPSPTANDGTSLIPANRQIQIPERSWFRFDAEKGTEKVWLVWSSQSVPALDAVRKFANARDRGAVKDPELDKAVKDFLQKHSDSRPAAEQDAQEKETIVRWNGDILTHLLRFERQ